MPTFDPNYTIMLGKDLQHTQTHQVSDVGLDNDIDPEVEERVPIDGCLSHDSQLVIEGLGSCHNGVHLVSGVGREVTGSVCVCVCVCACVCVRVRVCMRVCVCMCVCV